MHENDAREDDAGICRYERCNESAWKGSSEQFCIYHAKENGEDSTIAGKVWNQAREKLRNGHYNFQGWHFPPDPEMKEYPHQDWNKYVFIDVVFKGEANFSKATFDISCDHQIAKSGTLMNSRKIEKLLRLDTLFCYR